MSKCKSWAWFCWFIEKNSNFLTRLGGTKAQRSCQKGPLVGHKELKQPFWHEFVQIKYGGTKSYMPYMSVLFVFTILFFDLQKILHLIFIQWNHSHVEEEEPDLDEDLSNLPMRKLRWLHNHRKVSFYCEILRFFDFMHDKRETASHHHQQALLRSISYRTFSWFQTLEITVKC